MDQIPMSEEVAVALPSPAQSRLPSKASAAAAAHLLGLSLATLIASMEIRSILVSGWICSCSGIVAGTFAAWAGRWRSFVTMLMTPVLAICLVVLVFTMHLGPEIAAIPFSIVFLVHQTISSVVLIRDLRPYSADAVDRLSGKYTVRTLLVLMVLVAVFFSLYRLAIQTNNAACVAMALVLVILNIVGIAVPYIRRRVRKSNAI